MTTVASRGDRASAETPSSSREILRWPRRRGDSQAASPTAAATPHKANTGHSGSAPAADATTTTAASASERAAASAA